MKMQSKEAVDEPLAVNFLLSLLHMEPMCRSIWTTWILLYVRKAQGFFFFAFRTLSGAGHSCLVSPFQTRRKTRLNNVRLFLLSKKRWLNRVELALSLKILLYIRVTTLTYLHLEVAISMVFIYITVMSTLLLNGDTVMTDLMAHCTIGVYAMSWLHDELHVLTFLVRCMRLGGHLWSRGR